MGLLSKFYQMGYYSYRCLPAVVDTVQLGVLHKVAVLKEVLVLDTAVHTVHACDEECTLLMNTGVLPSCQKITAVSENFRSS